MIFFAKPTELPRQVSFCYLHAQPAYATAFQLGVPPLENNLLKIQSSQNKGKKTSLEPKETLSQRRVQLMPAGSWGSLLAQEVKTSAQPLIYMSARGEQFWPLSSGLCFLMLLPIAGMAFLSC